MLPLNMLPPNNRTWSLGRVSPMLDGNTLPSILHAKDNSRRRHIERLGARFHLIGY